VRFNLLSREPLQHEAEFFFLCGAQLDSGSYIRLGDPLPLPEHAVKGGRDFREELRSPMIRKHKEKIAQNFARPGPIGASAYSVNDLLDDPMFGRARNRGAREEFPQFPGLAVKTEELLELLREGLRDLLLEGNIGKDAGVL